MTRPFSVTVGVWACADVIADVSNTEQTANRKWRTIFTLQ